MVHLDFRSGINKVLGRVASLPLYSGDHCMVHLDFWSGTNKVLRRVASLPLYSGDHCMHSLLNWWLTRLTVFMKPAKSRPKLNFPGEIFIKFKFPRHWRVPKYWKIYFVITFLLLKVSRKFPPTTVSLDSILK